jgi:hypothetical protein
MPGRFSSALSVGVLAFASAVAGLWSARSTAGDLIFRVPPSGDPRAERVLSEAVRSDLGAESFIARVQLTTRRGSSSGREHYTLVYGAPDRSELIGPGPGLGSVVVTVGDMRYSQSLYSQSGPQWLGTKIPRGQPEGASMATVDLTFLTKARGAVERGATYRIVDVDDVVAGTVEAREYGVGEVQTTATAKVGDGKVLRESIDIRSQKTSVDVTITYSHFGSAPRIEAPTRFVVPPAPCNGRPLAPGARCNAAWPQSSLSDDSASP